MISTVKMSPEMHKLSRNFPVINLGVKMTSKELIFTTVEKFFLFLTIYKIIILCRFNAEKNGVGRYFSVARIPFKLS